ncbi:TrkH family potassium uptake protein [Catelliglobosispora koreensis]|uniref:TrkH family potassium uptake protein n=1 Tax=Catelliglobosispora koreensis TaxID=129052 RepID=UPI0003634B29|nr:potassium transporter TrkG [Catelliglobosispora koreensis]
MRRWLQHPARLVPVAFLCLIAVGTVLLSLPIARRGPGGAPFLTALFTSVSTGCVTGLSVVDVATYWTLFGHVVLLVLMQIGGFGIMALATLLSFITARRLGLSGRLVAQAETHAVGIGDLRGLLLRVAAFMVIVEGAVTVILALRLWLGYDYPFGEAVWQGFFSAVSSLNNTGYTLMPDNTVTFVADWWICLPMIFAIIAGSIGFPVIYELSGRRRPRQWSVHTRITVWGTAFLLFIGFAAMLTFEWNNPKTFGPLDLPAKILAALFQGTSPRTAGFNSVDFGQMNSETLLVTDWLMFIGGGSAGTSGGVKVTTFFLLLFVILAEVRRERDVVIGKRRIAESTQRQAITVALLSIAVVAAGTIALLAMTDFSLERVFFEAMSAFATVGLTTGITSSLGPAAQVVLILLMFVGRVGIVTVASALALSERPARYRYPEERPIVG